MEPIRTVTLPNGTEVSSGTTFHVQKTLLNLGEKGDTLNVDDVTLDNDTGGIMVSFKEVNEPLSFDRLVNHVEEGNLVQFS